MLGDMLGTPTPPQIRTGYAHAHVQPVYAPPGGGGWAHRRPSGAEHSGTAARERAFKRGKAKPTPLACDCMT